MRDRKKLCSLSLSPSLLFFLFSVFPKQSWEYPLSAFVTCRIESTWGYMKKLVLRRYRLPYSTATFVVAKSWLKLPNVCGRVSWPACISSMTGAVRVMTEHELFAISAFATPVSSLRGPHDLVYTQRSRSTSNSWDTSICPERISSFSQWEFDSSIAFNSPNSEAFVGFMHVCSSRIVLPNYENSRIRIAPTQMSHR